MDPQALVGTHLRAGSRLLRQLLASDFDVSVAFWAKPAAEGDEDWRFYIASHAAESVRRAEAYSYVLSFGEWRFMSPSALKLVPPTDPAAVAAAAARDTAQSRGFGIRLGRGQLGDLAIQEAYIYPEATRGFSVSDVIEAVATHVAATRGGPVAELRVEMRSGTVAGVPLGMNWEQPDVLELRMLVQFPSGPQKTTVAVQPGMVTAIWSPAFPVPTEPAITNDPRIPR